LPDLQQRPDPAAPHVISPSPQQNFLAFIPS
jgi:hypothetical protein